MCFTSLPSNEKKIMARNDFPGTREKRDHEIRQKVKKSLLLWIPVWGHTSMTVFAWCECTSLWGDGNNQGL